MRPGLSRGGFRVSGLGFRVEGLQVSGSDVMALRCTVFGLQGVIVYALSPKP